MWRTSAERAASAARRLDLARALFGWAPHDKQRHLFTSTAQVTVAACGRRWGKTECLGMDIATLALDELAAGRECRQLVVAPSDTQARLIGGEVLRLLLAAMDKGTAYTEHISWTSDGVLFTVRQRPALQMTLTHPDHPDAPVVITCRTAGRDGRGLRGLWAHKIVVDEGAYVPDSVLNDVLMPMLLDKGGDYLLASSPCGKRSAYYRLYARALSGSVDGISEDGISEDAQGITYAAFQFPTVGNPHLDLAFLHSQREEMGEVMFAQEYEADFLDTGGSVFREDDIDAAVQSDGRVSLTNGELLSEPAAGRIYSIGVDWGRKLDFTVVSVLDVTEPVGRVVWLTRWQGTGWEAQIEAVAAIVARFDPWSVLGDGSGIGDTLTERLQAAIKAAVAVRDPLARVPRFETFLFTGDSKQQLVDKLNLRLSSRTLAYPSHRVLLSELRQFEYLGNAGASGRARMGASGRGHDDVVMSLALAVYAAPASAPVPLSSRLLLGSGLGGGKRAA